MLGKVRDAQEPPTPSVGLLLASFVPSGQYVEMDFLDLWFRLRAVHRSESAMAVLHLLIETQPRGEPPPRLPPGCGRSDSAAPCHRPSRTRLRALTCSAASNSPEHRWGSFVHI